MRRFISVFLVLFLLFRLPIGVSAATGASSVNSFATVSQDGSCQVSLTVNLHLEQAVEDLTFPVPLGAKNITLNGAGVSAAANGTAQLIDLSAILSGVTGDVSLVIHYTLDSVVQTGEDGTMELQIPILSGFAYPVQALEFSVTLPGQITQTPSFSSAYYKSEIERYLSYTLSGATITGSSLAALKDRETLMLTLTVSEELFPQPELEAPDHNMLNVAITLFAVLALLYWILFLRCAPPRRKVQPIPPEGCTAGELGSVLTGRGTDLTMMVFTWAQLGYILIHVDRHDRVTLHKRMDMGNERSAYEQRWFKKLFGKKTCVDTSGARYAQLCKDAQKLSPNVQMYLHRRSGNRAIFRVLCAAIALLCGASIGASFTENVTAQWVFAVLIGLAGAFTGWDIQRWAFSLLGTDKRQIRSSLILCGIWLTVSLIAGELWVGIMLILSQLLAGLMSVAGGRRTPEGRRAMSQVMGLRRFLRGIDRGQLQEICERNPDYFHTMMPAALALNVDKAFAKRFGDIQQPACPYLTTGMDGHRTASEWSELMRRAVSSMDANRHKGLWDKFMGIVHGFGR